MTSGRPPGHPSRDVSPWAILDTSFDGAAVGADEAQGEFSKSIETLTRYLELSPDDVEARIVLGEQLAARKRYDEAVAGP